MVRIPTFSFWFSVWWDIPTCAFFTLERSFSAWIDYSATKWNRHVGKIPAKSKTLYCKHDQRIADRPTAGIEALPHYHQLLVIIVRRRVDIIYLVVFVSFLFHFVFSLRLYVVPSISILTATRAMCVSCIWCIRMLMSLSFVSSIKKAVDKVYQLLQYYYDVYSSI